MFKARRDFIKAFALSASAGALSFSHTGLAQSATDVIPAITLLLGDDPQFVFTTPSSATVGMASPFLADQAKTVTVEIFLDRPPVSF